MHGELNSVYLLGAFALGVVLSCRCVLQLVLGVALDGRRWSHWIFIAGALALTGILAADAIRGIAKSEDPSLAPILGLSIFSLALLSLPLHVQAASPRLPARERIMRPTAWLLLAWTIGASAWSGARFYQSQMPMANELAIAPRPVLQVEQQAAGVSDRGQPIALFRVQLPASTWPAGFLKATPALARMAQTVIRRDGPSANSNCHGWVFAGGKYLLDGEGVLTILEDNGYEPCRDPRPGDLIVYRSQGRVVHSGLVSGVLADGTVLIESKWNLQERFLHRPEDQPYSREYTFYRTPRGSHQITIRQGAATAVTRGAVSQNVTGPSKVSDRDRQAHGGVSDVGNRPGIDHQVSPMAQLSS